LHGKAHNDTTLPLVLHRTNWQMRRENFFILIANCKINYFGLASFKNHDECKKNLREDCLAGIGRGAIVLTKSLHFYIFQLPKAEQRPFPT
jgi:hypothetical protein